MDREELNVFIDALLSLGDGSPENREGLVELAFYHDDWDSFLAEWLWFNKRGMESALALKLWMSWSYEELAEVFALDFRGIAQVLRTQRVARLGNYPSAPLAELPQHGGVSCFMVEQQLSSWVDSEWEETSGLQKIKEHLQSCADCYRRLGAYRNLNQEILSQRRKFQSLAEEEWQATAENISRRQTRSRWQWVATILIAVAFILIILWMLKAQPEKMPNIYEIKEI